MTTNHLIRSLAGLLCVAALAACGSSPESADVDVASLGTQPTTAADDPTGDPTDETATSDSIDPEDAMVSYTACMRDEGIDMPDAQMVVAGESGAAGGGQVVTVNSAAGDDEDAPMIDFDSEEYAAAEKVCGPILDDAFGDIEIDPELEAEQREQMLAFAQCMRDEGIDYPDPEFGENGQISVRIGSDGESMDESDREAMDAAFEVCAELMGDGGVLAAVPVGG